MIPIIFAEDFSLIILANLFNEKKVFFTFINLFLGTFFTFLLTTTLQAPLERAFFTKLCPSFLLPRTAKNKLFFFIVFELIETQLKFEYPIFFLLNVSLSIEFVNNFFF